MNQQPEPPVATGLGARALAGHALLTFLLMLPETMPVPVLKGLVLNRFGVGHELALLFMSANMCGALLAAPLVGLYVDRTGKRRRLALFAAGLDAVLMQLLAHAPTFASFLLLRVAEGAAHIAALTLLMSLVADAAGVRRGRALGCVGVGLTLGVANGVLLGGRIGRDDPVATLHASSAVLAVATLLGVVVLARDTARTHQPGYRELVAAVRNEPRLRAPLLLSFIDRLTIGFISAGMPLLLGDVRGLGGARIGVLLALFLFPMALLSYPFGRLAERWSRRALAFWGSLGYGAGVAVIGVTPDDGLWLLMPALGLCSAVMFVPTLLWLIESAPGVGRSTLMGLFHLAGSLGFLIGPVCCGAIVRASGDKATGYAVAFAVAGVSEVAGAWLAITGRHRAALSLAPDAPKCR